MEGGGEEGYGYSLARTASQEGELEHCAVV